MVDQLRKQTVSELLEEMSIQPPRFQNEVNSLLATKKKIEEKLKSNLSPEVRIFLEDLLRKLEPIEELAKGLVIRG